MASLDAERKKRIRKRKMKLCVFLFFLSLIITPYLIYLMDCLLGVKKINFVSTLVCYKLIFSSGIFLQLFFLLEILVVLYLVFYLFEDHQKIGMTKMQKITDTIEIPVAIGQGQHGTARFLNEQEKESLFKSIKYEPQKDVKKENLGLVVGMEKQKETEIISCIADDIHSIIIGATRSGKSRGIILESIWMRGKTGGSMIISDPKGELYLYTNQYLKEQGYNVIPLDFRQPLKSKKYNYLGNINQSIDQGDIPKAIDQTWDLVSVLVGEPKGEPLWTNGESAVIAAAILAVAMEAPKECRNMTNVYYFLSNMCKQKDEFSEMPITKYFRQLDETHPARGVFSVAELSPERTRASFFSSALATLRLFTNWNIADMTSDLEFDLKDIGKKPTALFIIIPDEKKTLYSLVSIFVSQAYMSLVELANECGGRVPNTVEFLLDEFGNFPTIPGFGSMLSVGAGRGLRFNLVLQDYQQLEKNYKEDCENIKGNCVVTIYLKTPTQKTLEELSKRTGTYTVQSASMSDSTNHKGKSSSFSSSVNMQSRALLTADEIGRIERPYSLIFFSGTYPSIFHAPDLSQYHANKELGLGDKKHNEKIILERDQKREKRELQEIKLWKIWNEFEEDKGEKHERVSFL